MSYIWFFAKATYGFRPIFYIVNYLRRAYDIDPVSLIEFIINESENNEKLSVLSECLGVPKKIQDSILDNKHEIITLPDVKATLFPEVAILITALRDKDLFFQEIDFCIKKYCQSNSLKIIFEEYIEVVVFQYAKIPSWKEQKKLKLQFKYDWPGYFDQDEMTFPIRQLNRQSVGEDEDFTDPDDFLGKKIYGGMIFNQNEISDEVISEIECRSAESIYHKLGPLIPYPKDHFVKDDLVLAN